MLGGGIGAWEYPAGGRNGFPDTADMMRHAFAKNPYMHVLIAEGFYDAATPYFGVEYTLNHMGLTPEMHKNIKRDTFTAGHMVYIDNDSLIKLKNDVNEFYSSSQR